MNDETVPVTEEQRHDIEVATTAPKDSNENEDQENAPEAEVP